MCGSRKGFVVRPRTHQVAGFRDPGVTLHAMGRGRPPSWSTVAAVAMMSVITGVFTTYAVAALRRPPGDATPSRDAVFLGLSGQQESNATTIAAILMLVVSVVTLAECIGVAQRRQSARHAALMTFGLLSFVSLAAALPGLTARPPSPNAAYGVLAGLADAAVVVLLLLPATMQDVELVELQRERSRVRRA